MDSLTLDLRSLELTDEQFYQLCTNNSDLRIERNANGDLVIMPPTGGETGNRNIEIAYQLQAWSRQDRRGIAFDSSTGFILPNGANRSLDASWIPYQYFQSYIETVRDNHRIHRLRCDRNQLKQFLN